MRQLRLPIAVVISAFCSACGTYVPGHHEFYQSRGEGSVAIAMIINNVVCETRDAVYDIINRDKNLVFNKTIPERQTKWLDDWGAQLTLNLTVNEKGGITPSVLASPASASLTPFSIAAGGTLSSEANRIDKLHAYYSVRELSRARCDESQRPGGLYLMQSDLKLREWLSDVSSVQATNFVKLPSKNEAPFNQDVISHEVQFMVTTSSDLTPTWKLIDVTVNPNAPLLSAGRVRTHNLLITLGPMDKKALANGKYQPSQAAQNSNLASDIGIAVRNNIGNGRPIFGFN